MVYKTNGVLILLQKTHWVLNDTRSKLKSQNRKSQNYTRPNSSEFNMYEGRLKSSTHHVISLKRIVKTIIKYIFSKRSIICLHFKIVNCKFDETVNVANGSKPCHVLDTGNTFFIPHFFEEKIGVY